MMMHCVRESLSSDPGPGGTHRSKTTLINGTGNNCGAAEWGLNSYRLSDSSDCAAGEFKQAVQLVHLTKLATFATKIFSMLGVTINVVYLA